MQLRKVGNHPLLLRFFFVYSFFQFVICLINFSRVYYDDKMIRKISQILKSKDGQYKRDSVPDIVRMI
jgi:hypothetical protein